MIQDRSPLKLFDTHAHLDLEHFGENLEDLLERSARGIFPEPVEKNIAPNPHPENASGKEVRFVMDTILVPGISSESSRNCVELAEKHSLLFAAVGIHPNSAREAREEDWAVIERLSTHPRVVAIGETGLDRYWDRTPFEIQLEYFERHIELCKRNRLPILVHSRETDEDLIAILERESRTASGERLRGVIHSFSSGPQIAEKCVEYGFYISFSGALTYTNRKFAPLWEAATVVPGNRLLIETDSPYLCPHPYRSKLVRNEPLMCAFTARRLSELRNCSLEEIIEQTTRNALDLFHRDENKAGI